MSQMVLSSCFGGAGENLFLSEEMCNVTISVKSEDGSEWRFPAHRLVLSAQSLVFCRMLESNFSEKDSGAISINDIKPKIVELMLGYMYRGRVTLENWRDGLDLLKASHKYQMGPLVEYCEKFLENVIDLVNVCYIYNDACIYSLLTLKEKCLKLILDAGFILLRSKAFKFLTKDAVMDIITNRELNIDSELTVFNALLKWAPMQCCRLGLQASETNILKELKPFLSCVCSDDMSDTDKSELPPVVLSCLRPNNRNRIAFYIPESLLPYSKCFDFQINPDESEFVGGGLCCIRFSLDSPLSLIALQFMIMSYEFPSHLPLTILKESGGCSYPVVTINTPSSAWVEAHRMGENSRYEAFVCLRQPCFLEAKTVYKLLVADRVHVHTLKTNPVDNCILLARGNVNFNLHSDNIWGLQSLRFL